MVKIEKFEVDHVRIIPYTESTSSILIESVVVDLNSQHSCRAQPCTFLLSS